MAESGIGTKAENIKALVVSTLGTYDQRRFYPFLTNEVNPFKKDAPGGRVVDLRLDDVLQMRIEAVLLDPARGLPARRFATSADLALKELQKNYTAAVDAYRLAHNNKAPAGADLDKLNKDFLTDDKNKKLLEDLKITLLDDNKAKLTTAVATARATDAFVTGTANIPQSRTFFTPVIVGAGDPGVAGDANAAAFKLPAFRSWYLDLAVDARNQKLVMGHRANDSITVGRTPDHRFFTPYTQRASVSAAPGQYIPYEKMFEMAMDYYNGDSAKHKLLGAKEAKKKGDAVVELVNIQAENQKNLLDKQGNANLKAAGLGENSFTNLQQPLDNFLDDIARFQTNKMGDKVTLDVTKVDIKNPDVIKAIEDAFNEAEKDIKDKGANEVIARKRALSQNDYLKELLKKHPKPAPGRPDTTSAKTITDLVEKHALPGLVWEKEPNGERLQGAALRDAKRLAAIALFSEAYELRRVLEDMKNLKEAIKNHYPLGFGMADPKAKDALAALAGPEAEALRRAVADYTPGEPAKAAPAAPSKPRGLAA